MNSITSRLPRFFNKPSRQISIFIALLFVIIFSPIYLVLAIGTLNSSAVISGEPLVGGDITFSISVINLPDPPPGTYFTDRLYNITGEIILPQYVTLGSCSIPPSSAAAGPGVGETTITFDNIKNLEVNEVITISCTATLGALIDLGNPFTIGYRWESNTLPDESGTWVYSPGPGAGNYSSIVAQPQAFDLEKFPNPNTGEVQVNGAGAYAAGAGGTGVNWPYDYTLTLTNNPLNPSTGLQVVDIIPPGVAYLGNDAVVCDSGSAPSSVTPTRTLLGDGSIQLVWDFPSINPGEICAIGYDTAIPYRYRTGADTGLVVGGGPFTGAIIPTDVTHINTYEATGDYQHPINGPTPSSDGTTSTPQDDVPATVTSGYHSIAKGVSSGDVLQDDDLTYTIDGWISEYYDFTASAITPYVITDILPDGLDYCGTGPGVGPNGFYGDCTAISVPQFNGAPLIPVSVAQDASFNLVIIWHMTNPAAVQAGATWQLVYDAQVRDFYAADPTQPVSGLDVRPNRAIASGEWNDRITVGRTGTDDTRASASVSLTAPDLDKQILDPVSGTFVDGPVEVEIGQRLTYRVAITFAEDLDMRNVIVDDFLPRGQRYIPNSADFTGSQDYPGTPQTAPGDYTGTTYGAEQFEAFSGFFVDDCPSAGRYPGPSDPFLTSPQFLGGLQDLVWRLCRVDNSDSGVSILWQVVFDAVVVDDPAIFEGYQIANFGNLSGTNSFGTTYSLRDNLDMTYIVPNLVTRKSNNAPNPLSVGSGTFAYSISIENVQQGTAYDWTIRDTVPAGIRVPGGGVCTGFTTTAPGAFECVADAGAQAGTGGFVTIRPVAAGVHDPARPFPGLTTYNFSFNSELAPDATPAESLTNTASVEYCTSATPDDLNADGTIDRRCIGYLDPDPLVFDGSDTPHSDEGTPPNFADFIDYTDDDDPASSGAETNGSDNSTVNIVEVGTDKSHTQPTHTPPQVVTGDFATIGEVYQVTLEITIPGRTHLFVDPVDNYVEIIDTFTDEGAIFCDAASAITGCTDPAITQPGALVTPNAAAWWAANNLAPAVGSTVRFFFNEIDNSAAVIDYTFTITFTMQVTGTDDSGNPVFFMPTTTDTVDNSFVVRYFDDNTPTANQFTTPPEPDSINIDQPVITTDKEAVRIVSGGSDICTSAATCDGVTVQGGDTIYYQSVYTNSGESTAMDVSLVDQLPLYVIFNNDLACTSTIGINGGVVGTVVLTPPSSIELQIDTTPAGNWDIPPGGNITCTYSVDVETVVPAGTDLTNFTDADWSTIDSVPGPNDPPERVFDDTPDDGDGDEDEETVPVEVPTMGKIRTSPGPTGSPSTAPIRIGDVVQYQITIPLPIGETRNLIVTDTFDPGLILYTSGPAFTFVTNSTTLVATQTLNGTNDGIGAFSVDWGLRDPACTGTPPCIINDGVNNTAVTITFRAVVADVPLNINGLILDNTVSATYVDGNGVTRTANDEGPFDDEEVQIIEPQITLVKDVAPTTADAGDTLTYTVTITNTATPTSSDPDQPTAYDVTWEDDLDNRVQYVPGSMVCTLNGVGTTAIVTGTDPINITNNADQNLNTWDLRPGSVDTLVCTYQALVLQSVPPTITLDNTADADWTSQDGVLTGSTTDPNERIYDDRDRDPTVDSDGDGDPTNDDDDGTADEDVAQVQVPTPTIDKIVGPSTDPNYQADNQYQPGELIPYQITIVLPEGTTEQLTITDTFNANLQFEAGSTTISSVPAGVSIATGPTIVGNTVTWVLNDIVYTGTPATANPPTTGYTITLGYRLRVRNTAANGASYTNTASARYDANGDNIIDANDPPAITDTAVTGIETPVVTITKTENDADNLVDAGDVVTYTVTLTNTRGAAGGIAYDVFFTENLDDDTDYVVGSMVCNYDPAPAGAPFTPLTPIEFDLAPFDGIADAEATTFDNFRVSGGAAENSNPWFLNGGDRIICTYDVTVNANVQAGDPSILNSVTVTSDTADNDQLQEVTTTSTPVTTTLSVPSPTLAKDVDATAAEYQADGTYQPGDLVPYVITVTVPEGQVTDLNVTDTLPTGFQFVSTTSVTTSWAATLTPTGPASGATGTVTWAFGNVAVPGTTTGPTASFETISIRFLLRVTASAPTGAATNTAAGNFDPPGTSNTPIPPDTAVVQVDRPAISVVKTENDVDNIVDAGDVVTYTVVITNTSTTATAYDTFFTDNLDDDTDYVAPSMTCAHSVSGALTFQIDAAPFDGTPDAEAAALDSFRVAGNLSEGSNTWDLLPGESITCSYQVVMNLSLGAGDPAIVNTVSGQFDSADGDVPEEDFTGSDDTILTSPAPTFVKTRTSANDNVQVGEIVSYRIVVTVPEGTTNGLIVQDTLPAGFEFVSFTVVNGWGVPALPGFSTQPAANATGLITWTFAAGIQNPGDNNAANNTVTFDYEVRVTTSAGGTTPPNGNGDDTLNRAEVFYTPVGGSSTSIGVDDAPVDVIRPTLNVVKSATPGLVDAADVVTYTVVITNTSVNGATIYDVTFTDNPNDFISVDVSNFVCNINGGPNTNVEISPNVNGADPFTVGESLNEDLNDWDLAPGDVLTCTYNAVVDGNVPATSTLTNIVNANGTTADGDVPGEDDIPDDDDAQVATFDPQIDKALNTADTVYAPGELVPYVVTIRVPEGAILDLQFTDTLPAGLRFDSMGPISGGFALVGGAPSLVSGPTDGSAPATYRFDFVDPVIVPSTNNTNSIDYVDITVRYFARVTSTIDAATLINTVSGTYDTGNGGDDVPIGTDTTTVIVEIPTQDTTKVITQIDPDGTGPLPPVPYTAGDTVEGGAIITYQVTLTNTDATATLYDVTLVENPPDLVSYNAGSTSCTLASLPTTTLVSPDVANADPFTITNNLDENLNTWDLTPGQSLVCTYTVTVDTDVPAGLNLINLVTGNGSSANGDVPDEIDIPDTATTTIPTSAPEILKSVADPIPPVVTIGQEIEYLLVMQLPIGITTDLVIMDTLEGVTTNTGIDLRVVSGTTTITRGGVDISAGVTETVTTNADGEQVITWDFITPLTYDPAAAPDNIENIEIRFTAVVEDIANNDDGDVLWNFVSAVLSPDGGTTIVNITEDDTTDNDVLLAVPALEVDKAHDDANGRVEPGQIVTYTVTVRNVGTGLAQNLIIDDLMPVGWTYVTSSSTLDLAAIGDPAIAGQALTWNLDALVDPDPVLNGIGALVLTYQAIAPNPLVGSPYTNLAEASGNDSIGNPIPEDNTDHVTNDTDLTDDAATTLTAAAAIQGVVWHDVDADGVIDATEAGIPGVTVQLYDSLGNLVATTTTSSTTVTYAGVTYPVGTYLFTDLPPGDYTIIELQTGPILNWESTADADTPPGTGATPDDYNEIAVTGLTAGEIREDQNFGERYAGLIQGFVYLDPNGDGSNTVPPGGGDTGIQNVTVSLYDSTGTLVATTTTDATGYYQFPNLLDGTYTVVVDDNDTDITSIDPNINFTPGAVNTVGGLVVDVTGGGPVPEAHFPFRTPAALAIVKTGYDLNGTPLLPGETVGWIVCVLNPDALAAPNVTITDPIDTVRLTFVAGSVQTGIVAACPATALPAGLTAQPAAAPDGTGTLTINYGSVPAGQYAVLYFETTVTDPFTWGGGWLSVLSLLVFGWLRNRRPAQNIAWARYIVSLLLITLLIGGLSLSSIVRSQEEGTPEVTDAPTAEVIQATEEATPETTETVAPTEEVTPEITEMPESTEEATPEPTDEATIEATAEATIDATDEATVEATAEATDEATPEVTVEATDEATPEATAEADLLVTLTGRVYDDTNASLTDDEGEPGIAGVTVTAFDEDDRAAASAVTDENGVYTLTGLAPGDYTVRVGTLPDGYIDVLTLGERGEQTPASIRIDEVDPDLMTGMGLYAIQGEHFAYVRDTDGDGTPDGVEGSGDRDGDGIPNYLDPFDPSGVFYIVDTGNIVLNVDSALYADMDNNCTLDTSIDQLANTVQANPQTSINGGYRYDIRITDATDLSATGIPGDGSSRCFFLEITDFPASVVFPSTVVPAEAGALTTGGAVVTSPIPPTLPVTPATHRFFLVFQIDQTQDEIINNHVAFDAAPILLNQSVSNEATASRDGLPPVSDDDTLILNNTLGCSMTPNGTTVLEPGQSYTFNHILTNTGTQTDTYTITYSTSFPAWTQSLTPAAGTTVTLAPGATQAITYTITVPAGTVDTTTNVTTITATSGTAPNPNCSALDVTTVIAACVNGILYNDTNLNGVQDIGENGLAGVTLNVFDSTNTLVATLVTAGDGSYNLGGLPSGTYRVEIDEATLPEGTVFYVDPNVPEQTLTIVAGGTCAIGSFGLVIYDPAITKNGTPDQAEPGDTIVFTITVTNNSTANITGVIVRDPLPSYFDFLSASTTAGTFTFNSGTNTVIFDIGTMTPGQVTTMVVRVRVNASAPAPGTVTNRAIFTYNEGNQQTASDSVTIPPPPPAPPGTDPTPTPEPSPTPMTIALGSVPGTGVGGAVIPSQFPSQLPLTGSRPAPNGLAMLGLSFVVFVLVAVGLAALSLIVFRNRIGAMGIAKPLAGFMLILGAAIFAGAAAFGVMWMMSDPTALEIAQEMSEPQASRPQPTAVSIINPSMLAGNAAIAALVPNDANTLSAITRSPFVSLVSWNNQFIQAEIPATRIVIPALDIDTDLVEAPIKDDTWDVTVFTNEIAHLEGTAYLGTTGNAVIAGHITHQNGYGPFRYLEQLKQGDIILAYGDGVEYRYVVRFTHYIEPDDIEYALPMDGKYLTLISCAGWDQATWTYQQRLIVRAELVSQ